MLQAVKQPQWSCVWLPNPMAAQLHLQDSMQLAGSVCKTSRHCRYKDSVRSGWRNIMDFVVRLYRLSLLPIEVYLMEDENLDAARQRLPRPSSAKKPASTNIVYRAISKCVSA